MSVRMQARRMMGKSRTVAAIPPKKVDPFYLSAEWARLKALVRARSGGVCEIEGCNRPARVCDHIKRRRDGGLDHQSNLRDLCDHHDRKFKESWSGSRQGVGG